MNVFISTRCRFDYLWFRVRLRTVLWLSMSLAVERVLMTVSDWLGRFQSI
jgi:hypothetical protein